MSEKIKDILKYEFPRMSMTVGWKESQGFCIYYKNAKRESLSWYNSAKETMQKVEELYQSHKKIPAMIRKGLE